MKLEPLSLPWCVVLRVALCMILTYHSLLKLAQELLTTAKSLNLLLKFQLFSNYQRKVWQWNVSHPLCHGALHWELFCGIFGQCLDLICAFKKHDENLWEIRTSNFTIWPIMDKNITLKLKLKLSAWVHCVKCCLVVCCSPRWPYLDIENFAEVSYQLQKLKICASNHSFFQLRAKTVTMKL